MHSRRTTTVSSHRRVRNGRPRHAARSVAVPSPAAPSTGLSVRRRASTEHLGSAPGGPSQPPCPAFTPSRPKFRANAASVAPWLRSPAKLLSLRGQPFLAGQHCVHQSTNITFSCRRTAPRSMAGGSLIDPRPSRPSSSMYRRPSDGSWSLAMADAWRCPASAEAPSELIDGGTFRSRDRLGAVRASVGRARRRVAARRTARSAACVREGDFPENVSYDTFWCWRRPGCFESIGY